MSNIQQYLLISHSDKEKALRIARDTARGMLPMQLRATKADVSRA